MVVVVWGIAAGLYFLRTGRFPVPLPDFERDALAHDLEELTVAGDVLFEYRSTVIRSEGERLLDGVARLLVAHPGFDVFVDGHADSTGEPDDNRVLSQRRAEAVVTYLVGAGVPADQLTARGYGDIRPRAVNDTDEGRALNRRVEFTLP